MIIYSNTAKSFPLRACLAACCLSCAFAASSGLLHLLYLSIVLFNLNCLLFNDQLFFFLLALTLFPTDLFSNLCFLLLHYHSFSEFGFDFFGQFVLFLAKFGQNC
jgi:hypothetical protein